ncbi:hypothetical protein RND81_06G248300 [Saponaria officinalis]
MAAKSPTRSMGGDFNGMKSPLRESGVTEFDGGLSKSPMRDRFLDDLVMNSDASRDVSRSPMRDRGGYDEFDRDGLKSPARLRYVSKSPVRVRGGISGSVGTNDVSGLPVKEGMGLGGLDGVVRSPRRSINGDAPRSPLRRSLGSEDGGNVDQGGGVRLAPKASFNDWLPDDNHESQSRDSYTDERRKTWGERAEDRPDQISEGAESVVSDERGTTSEGSNGNSIHGIGRRGKGEMYKDGGFRSDYVGFDGPSNRNTDSNYGYGGPRQSFETQRGSASVRELQLQRAELLRKYKELKDQLSDLDDAEVSSQGFCSESVGYPVDEPLNIGREPKQQFPPHRNVQRPPHFNRHPDLSDRRGDMYGYNYNHPLNDNQYVGHMKSGTPSNQRFSKRTERGYVPGRSLDFERDCYESVSSYSVDHESYGPRAYDPRMAHTNPRGRSPYPAYHHSRMSVGPASLNKRLCRPISGGAPFVLCNNCFQLLKLPGNFVAKHKNQQLQCGSCSTVISFGLQHEPSVPESSQKKRDSVDTDGGSSEVIDDAGPKHRHNSCVTSSTYIGSYDFDAGSDNFQPTGSEAIKGSKGHRFTSSLPENTFGFAPSPSRSSVDDHVTDTSSVRSGQRNASEMPVKTRPPPGSPLQDHLDYSTQFSIIEKHTSDVSDATETEIPRNELPTSLSQDTWDDPIESPVREKNKGAQSPINALLKPLKDVAGLGTPGKVEVYVNGQAISQRAAKKAEKLAGKIHPGEYWYDPKAGFWGVMGHQCLGIIPPSIKEFSAPMPENCSKGDSAVYVNGRELNKRDMGLLARRGLPTTKDRRYVVDISGRVLDEDTRDFIVNLGRLAPSVERKKCGFGMEVPQQLND